MSLDSVMTVPSSTRAGTTPFGLIPKYSSEMFSFFPRSMWWLVQGSSFSSSSSRTRAEQFERLV